MLIENIILVEPTAVKDDYMEKKTSEKNYAEVKYSC